jgi:hypothetical protein
MTPSRRLLPRPQGKTRIESRQRRIIETSEPNPQKNDSPINSIEAGSWSEVKAVRQDARDSTRHNRMPASNAIDASERHR